MSNPRPLLGASCLLRGLRLLAAPGLRRFVLLPLLINIVVFSLLIVLAAGWFDGLVAQFLPQLPEWLAWLGWLLWLLFALTAALLLFFTFTLVANLIGAPFNGLLAEAVERRETGRRASGDEGLGAALKQAPGALVDELRKLAWFALRAAPLLLLFLIPGLNLLAPLLWILFSAWILLMEYADYPLGNHGLSFADQRRLLARHRLTGLGFGGSVLLATIVPLLNLVVMPAAVIGATLLYLEALEE